MKTQYFVAASLVFGAFCTKLDHICKSVSHSEATCQENDSVSVQCTKVTKQEFLFLWTRSRIRPSKAEWLQLTIWFWSLKVIFSHTSFFFFRKHDTVFLWHHILQIDCRLILINLKCGAWLITLKFLSWNNFKTKHQKHVISQTSEVVVEL